MEFIRLATGASMPLLGFGTYLIKDLAVCERAVGDALEAGYRLIDTAQFYGNEEAVGRAIRRSGVPRGELFVTTKLWISDMSEEKAAPAFGRSLERLGMDYVDLYLLHHPFGDVYGAWRAAQRFFRDGRARAIGVSNFYADRVTDLALNNEIRPHVDQLETHPYHQRREMEPTLAEYGTAHQAWGPFSQGKTDLLENPVLKAIGEKHGKTTAQVCLRWLTQRGVCALPKSTHKARIRENFQVFDFRLCASDMAAIALLDTGKPAGTPHTDPNNIKRIYAM